MKTILKIYNNYTAARAAFEEDCVSYRSSGITFSSLSSLVIHVGQFKIFYKSATTSPDVFRGLTVDEIYFDDLVNEYDRLGIGGIVKIRKNEETSKESEEFYYVVEDKVGSVTRTVRTNDKSFVETLFRESR